MPPSPAHTLPCCALGRLSGVEGLRGLCVAKAVCEDAAPWLMTTTIPPPWCIPAQDIGVDFGKALIAMFYAPGQGGARSGRA